MKKHIPNFITCLNLFCGCIALVQLCWGNSEAAAYLIYGAAFLDLLDGMVARWLNAHSEIGKELDSLADVVSFGLVPGAAMFSMLAKSNLESIITNETILSIVVFFPFIITIFSALRLAKFNIDTRQTTSFIGLPTPANALLIISLPLLIKEYKASWNAVLLNPLFIIAISIALSYLLVSELPMFSMKMKTFTFRDNKIQFVFIGISVVLFAVFLFKAIPLIIILYILLSLVNYLFKKQM